MPIVVSIGKQSFERIRENNNFNLDYLNKASPFVSMISLYSFDCSF